MTEPVEAALAAGEAGEDERARDLVAPLLSKTQFPDDDGEDVPAEPDDGIDAHADLPAVTP